MNHALKVFALVAFLVFTSSAFSAPDRAPKLKPKVDPPTGLGDPEIGKAWYFETIGLPEVWKKTQGSPQSVIAFVDSGIDYNHPEIAPNLLRKDVEYAANRIDDDGNGFLDDVIGWNFVTHRRLPFDLSGHGTFLSVIAAGVMDNGIGTAGICPKCSILPVQFLDEDGLGDTEDAIKALRYAVLEGAKIINFSFAGEGYDRDLEDAIRFADEHDALVVVAASNDGLDDDKEDIYPAKFNLPNMITIAASTRRDTLWKDSNWGQKTVHIAAPGDNLVGLWFGHFEVGSGTSDAAALVSGSAALLRTINPSLTGRQLKQILMNTARPVAGLKNKLVTGGVLDLRKAALCAEQLRLCL